MQFCDQCREAKFSWVPRVVAERYGECEICHGHDLPVTGVHSNDVPAKWHWGWWAHLSVIEGKHG